MKIKIYKLNETAITIEQIIALLHESFQERLNQGLKYSCSFMTKEQFIEKTKAGIVFVAIDIDSNLLVGTSTLNIHYKRNIIFGYMEFVAIKDGYKHNNIGSLLLFELTEVAKKEGCGFILSDTSTLATSAVRYHLKNGFKIIGLESYRSTNYWSYVFRMQLVPSVLWNNTSYMKLHYWQSYIFIKLTRNIDGTDTKLGTLYKKMRKLCKN